MSDTTRRFELLVHDFGRGDAVLTEGGMQRLNMSTADAEELRDLLLEHFPLPATRFDSHGWAINDPDVRARQQATLDIVNSALAQPSGSAVPYSDASMSGMDEVVDRVPGTSPLFSGEAGRYAAPEHQAVADALHRGWAQPSGAPANGANVDMAALQEESEAYARRERRERIATAVLAGLANEARGERQMAALAVLWADALIFELDR